jgi:lipid II:glycine glycyltransferase (peptidoglycan interpeptide bridge formation enzyme)
MAMPANVYPLVHHESVADSEDTAGMVPNREKTRFMSTVRFHVAESLSDVQARRWREFATCVPDPHYCQDPAWAEIERCRGRASVRCPLFFWAEVEGDLCLTAVGVRRRLPVLGRVFLEFNRGPNVADPAALRDWLTWLLATCGREVARIRIQPSLPLDERGDDVETLLDLHGFVRRRSLDTWTTLRIDIGREEAEIMASLRQQTRYEIRQSYRQGVEVSEEDTPEGWSTLARLQAETAQRTSAPSVAVGMIAAVSRHWLKEGAGGTVLVARLHGGPLAAALLITHRQSAYVPLIPSSRRQGKQSASHLLVWEAMLWAKSHGCRVYDSAGYSMTALPGESLWGINQFKRGFASLDHLTKSVALHEKVCSPSIVAAASAVRSLQAWGRGRDLKSIP